MARPRAPRAADAGVSAGATAWSSWPPRTRSASARVCGETATPSSRRSRSASRSIQSDRARAVADARGGRSDPGGPARRTDRAPPARGCSGSPARDHRPTRTASASAANARPRRSRYASRADQHPVIIKTGQQIATAQRERLLVLSGGDQGVEDARVDPHFRLAGQADRLAGGDQHPVRARAERATNARQRVAQARPRARLEHIRPQASGDLRARMDPRVQRQPAEQRLRGPTGRRRTPPRRPPRARAPRARGSGPLQRKPSPAQPGRTRACEAIARQLRCVDGRRRGCRQQSTRGAAMTVQTQFDLDAFKQAVADSSHGSGRTARLLLRRHRVGRDRPAHAAELAGSSCTGATPSPRCCAASPNAGSRRPSSTG